MQEFRKTLAALACLVVGVASFALSYVALRDVAVAVGAVPAGLGWLVPIVVDGGIICGSAVIWSLSKEQGARPRFPFLFVGVMVAVSVLINMAHADDNWLAKVIAALPPLILLGTLELVAEQGRRSARGARTSSEDATAATPTTEVVEHAPVLVAEEVRATVEAPVSAPEPVAPVVSAPEPAAPVVVTATSDPALEPVAPAVVPVDEAVVIPQPRTELPGDSEAADPFPSEVPEPVPAAAPKASKTSPKTTTRAATRTAATKPAAQKKTATPAGEAPGRKPRTRAAAPAEEAEAAPARPRVAAAKVAAPRKVVRVSAATPEAD